MLRFLLFAFYFVSLSLSFHYSRELMQKKYPGFGTNWLPLDTDNHGKPVIGYFTEVEPKFFTEIYKEVSGIKEYVIFPENMDLTLTLYTRKNPDGTIIKEDSMNTIFNKSKPTKFITHGWLSHGNSEGCQKIKNAFLQKYDANVFTVDWYHISKNRIYHRVTKKIREVGKEFSHFLNALVNYGADPLDIHLVGHSLGAHVSGFAARNVRKGKIGRITGLDPAGPNFDNRAKDERLSDEDAVFVDVIHTSGKYLGLLKDIGHVDLYPNGGSIQQPNCTNTYMEYFEACCHSISWSYFVESLTSPKLFDAYLCDSVEQMENNLQSCRKDVISMGDPLPLTARGIYYLFLNQSVPLIDS